jgi:hypothetical protein
VRAHFVPQRSCEGGSGHTGPIRTLLGKSRGPLSNAMGGSFTRERPSVSQAFERRLQTACPHVCECTNSVNTCLTPAGH